MMMIMISFVYIVPFTYQTLDIEFLVINPYII